MTGYFKFWMCFLLLFTELLFAAPNCNNVLAPKNPDVIAGNPVQFEQKSYPFLVYDNYHQNQGAFYIRPAGNREENLRKTKKYIILLHGVGADFSNPDSMIHQYGNYTGTTGFNSKGVSDVSYGKRTITNNKDFESGAYVEILPLPGSTYGGKHYKAMGKSPDKALINPIKRHIEEAKKYLPEDAEIIIHGRSYGATTAAALAHKNPGLVDKLILVGVAAPEKNVVKEVFRKIAEEEEKGKRGEAPKFEQDWEWINWYTDLVKQINWWEADKLKLAFGGAKTVIITGQNDFQITEKEAMMYADLDLKFDNVHYRAIPGIEHDASKTKQNSNLRSRMGVLGTMYGIRLIYDTEQQAIRKELEERLHHLLE